MKTKETILKEIFRNDPQGLLGEKTMPIESKDAEILIFEREDFNERVNQLLWETIDGCQDVIYTYKAKEISERINIYDIFEKWEVTGERFDNWSQCAFANIYDMIQYEININELISKHFANKYLSA